VDSLRQFPVIIGVTGHRDIAEHAVKPVYDAVVMLLTEWRRCFGVALHVMTALADGADQLVADAARCTKVPIIAVAPFPDDAYRKTLLHPNKFDEHWKCPALRLTLPDVPAIGCMDYHDRQYEQLGVLLIRRSHLLLALWDGIADPDGRAGTASVVDMRLHGDHHAATFQSPMFLNARSYLDVTNRGPLLHIFTPREGQDPGAARPAGSTRTRPAGSCSLLGLPDSKTLIPEAIAERERQPFDPNGVTVTPRGVLREVKQAGVADFDYIKELNGIIRSFRGWPLRVFNQQVSLLKADGVPPEAQGDFDFLRRLQAAADSAAQIYQGPLLGHFSPVHPLWLFPARPYRIWRNTRQIPRPGALFVFAAAVPLAVLLFEIYVEHKTTWLGLWALVAYLITYGGTTAFYKFKVAKEKWQSHFQDYRALAEAMRVQVYWAVSAVPAAVSDYYLRKQSGGLGWIQFALRGQSLWAAAVAARLKKPDRTAVEEGWIAGERKFFGDNAILHDRVDRRGRRWTDRLVGLGFLMSLVLLGIILLTHWAPPAGPARDLLDWLLEYRDELVVLAAALPAFGAFFSVSRDLRAYEAHAHSYALMHRMFDAAAEQLAKAGDDDAIYQDIVRELGREALAENAEWLVEHRHRKIEQRS